MSRIPLLQIDAFASRPFTGNPAAVCWLEHPRDAAWMQQVAAEMNLSETAFLEPHAEGFGLRWFTPTTEVNLCGHATLASAHALETWGRLAPGATARFLTRSGWLTAVRQGEWIELDFPAAEVKETPPPEGLEAALGAASRDWRYCGSGTGPLGSNFLIELADAAAVRTVAPDFAALRRLPLRSLAITAAGEAGSGYDFVSRFFAPSGGVNEDPVTGSAHTALTPYWARKLGRSRMRAYQASSRGGELRVEVQGARVKLGGQAVIVFRAELEA